MQLKDKSRKLLSAVAQSVAALVLVLIIVAADVGMNAPPSLQDQKPNTWVKRSPLPGGNPSPRLGYESSWDYDPVQRKLIRWGGHTLGNGHEQLSEVWTYDPVESKWDYLTTNNNPPGNCCTRDNVQVSLDNKFYRFTVYPFDHGWFWDHERNMRGDTVWRFDLATRSWRNMRPGEGPVTLLLGKPSMWDPVREVIWVYDTMLRVYDPYANTWHDVNPSREIGKRTFTAMELDPRSGKIVLFGDHYLRDERTWVYDITKNEWIDMKPPTHPFGQRTCPVFAFDSLHNKFIMLQITHAWDDKAAKDKSFETWTYDLAANTWTKMNPPVEPDFSGVRSTMMRFIPEHNLVFLENRTRAAQGGEQQVWTYRLEGTETALPPPVPAPNAPKLTIAEDGQAHIAWQHATTGAKAAGYRIYQGTGAKTWELEWKAIADLSAEATEYAAGAVAQETPSCYRVVSLDANKQEGESTPLLRTQPPVVEKARVDVLAQDRVRLTWEPLDDANVKGYIVESAPVQVVSAGQKASASQHAPGYRLTNISEKAAIGVFESITPEPISGSQLDISVDLSKPTVVDKASWRKIPASVITGNSRRGYDFTKPGYPMGVYAWRVRAVSKQGVVGGPSPYQLSIPNEVEDFYSLEDGKQLRLKWTASPHAGIRGYLVYRLNDRFNTVKERHVLLTPEPIQATEFTDPDYGGKPRRYYIVVVDALGQEGMPSAPVWAERKYKAVYDRWAAEDGWHQ